MSKYFNLQYVKKEQKCFLEHLKSIKGVNYKEETLKVPMWLVLSLLSELMEILNETKIHKWWDITPVDDELLKEELADFMAHLGNLSNILDTDLITSVEEVQTTSTESQFIYLTYKITTLPWNKMFGKGKLDTMLKKFIELVYSLGFSMDEIEEAYKAKMKTNYERFK